MVRLYVCSRLQNHFFWPSRDNTQDQKGRPWSSPLTWTSRLNLITLMSPFAHWNISECQSGFMPVIPLSRPFSASLAPEKKDGNASTPLCSRKQRGYQVAQWNTVIQNNTKRDNKKKYIVRNARMNQDFGRKIRLNRKTNSWSIQNVQDWGWSLDNKEESCFLLPSLTMFFPTFHVSFLVHGMGLYTTFW